MILITLLGISVILVAVALRIMPRGGHPRLHLGISLLPLVLTMAVPLPFATVAVGDPTGWARRVVVIVSIAGIMLSFMLLTFGIVLTQRAAHARDRPGARVLALETALAGIPAVIITAYAATVLLL